MILRERGEHVERVGIAARVRQGARLEKAAFQRSVRRVLKIPECFECKPRRVVFPGCELRRCRFICFTVQLIVAARDVLGAAVFFVPFARTGLIPGGEQLIGVFGVVKLHAFFAPEKEQNCR